MEVLLAFIGAVIVALGIIQLSPYKIRVKSPEEKAMDELVDQIQDNFEQEVAEAQS